MNAVANDFSKYKRPGSDEYLAREKREALIIGSLWTITAARDPKGRGVHLSAVGISTQDERLCNMRALIAQHVLADVELPAARGGRRYLDAQGQPITFAMAFLQAYGVPLDSSAQPKPISGVEQPSLF